ncbi:DGQHR domain-containing protein [Klebsiella pneumoniae]|uniref:DGQHR domain-containing protein n=1 Tax=Klebsiella pneumoniae TaxID=573 RepID=UPI001C308172|nr:DGQHR domain-containing protein [Klebsiella pneumoniae]MBV2056687.1 DGQHR domain-containing protein [Klebsiella pneumoniae]MCB7650615.1 DGQHR domain-containing protein [Klebsiella pneumoniae]MCB7711841.1 DGQHR domain-containing protein [Klebsiella pneumoniae]MCB7764685.1 DGQHR domain-containing protein [Klebsiella pneumoniae]MCB7774127.1 DGQHR domain-containing protein [Klebsiella pneumoniae]
MSWSHYHQCLETVFGDIPAFTFSMKVKELIPMYYVAVRGRDNEEGAVQRVLNSRRITSIKKYVLDGNIFFSSFILNWTNADKKIVVKDGIISFDFIPASIQVIDGQHRLAGLEEAMEEDPKVGEMDILVTLCESLTTPQAAKIFLNINTEQKPVPKSLIYDLFGELEDDETHAINRITDIARELNDLETSPFYKLIKFPGSPRGVGNIELSTIVQSLKEHVKPAGTFAKYNIRTYDNQRNLIINFFNGIKYYYDKENIWNSKAKNPFVKAAGFAGAVDFLTEKLLSQCVERKSFTVDTIKSIISLEKSTLITWDELKNHDGKTARKRVKELLEENVLSSLPSQDEYEF